MEATVLVEFCGPEFEASVARMRTGITPLRSHQGTIKISRKSAYTYTFTLINRHPHFCEFREIQQEKLFVYFGVF